MDQYTFLINIFGIILGVAVAKVLEGIGRTIKRDTGPDIYIPHLLAAGLVILLIMQSWWGMIDEREVQEWTFSIYLQTLITPVLLYFMADIVSPDNPETPSKTHYWRHITLGFVLAALSLVNNSVSDVFLDLTSATDEQHLIRFAAGGVLVALAFMRQEWVHYVGYIFFYGAFVAYVSL